MTVDSVDGVRLRSVAGVGGSARAGVRRRLGRPGRVGCVPCGGAARAVVERGHRGVLEGDDVAVVADDDAGAVGGEAVAGDHDPARWWRCR